MLALEVNCVTALIPSQSTVFVQSQFKEDNNVSKVRKTIQNKCTASGRGISKTR